MGYTNKVCDKWLKCETCTLVIHSIIHRLAYFKVQYPFLESLIVCTTLNSTVLPVKVVQLRSFEVFITGFEQLPNSRWCSLPENRTWDNALFDYSFIIALQKCWYFKESVRPMIKLWKALLKLEANTKNIREVYFRTKKTQWWVYVERGLGNCKM